MFGYNNATDVDDNGKTIFHHLFTASKYCGLAASIASNCFGRNQARLAGSYEKAMSYKVQSGQPKGWTPLHILCQNNDILFATKQIIIELLENKVVPMESFDTVADNNGVTPLMNACGSGIADCVQELGNRGAKFDRLDNKKRGCLQRARQCQGNNQKLVRWLEAHIRTNLVDSNGKGRAYEERSAGSFSKTFRELVPMYRGGY